jgi:hypothetical protein
MSRYNIGIQTGGSAAEFLLLPELINAFSEANHGYGRYLQYQNVQQSAAIFSKTDDDWYETFIRKLEEFRRLSDNWDGQKASAPLGSAIDAARLALELAHQMEFRPRNVQVTRDGGIAISFLSGSKYGDIEFFDQESAAMLIEDLTIRDEDISEVAPVEEEINEALDRIREHIASA